MSGDDVRYRASVEINQLIQQAQGESPNRSAAAKALLILGAKHLGLDLSQMQHEILMLLMEGLSPEVTAELRSIVGDVSQALPQRPRPAPRSAPRQPRRATAAAAEPVPSRPPALFDAQLPTTPVLVESQALAVSPVASAGVYDIGEDI